MDGAFADGRRETFETKALAFSPEALKDILLSPISQTGSKEILVPWAVHVDENWRFWLNGYYTVRCEPAEGSCMEVARTHDGYLVGVSGCPMETWSPDGGYSDPCAAILW